MKRFIAVLICALMLTSLLPSVAFAEEGGDPTQLEGQQEGQNPPAVEDTTEDNSDEEESDDSSAPGENKRPDESLKKGLELTSSDPASTTETVTINAGATPSAAGSVTGSGTYDKGTQVTVTATANEGYVFVAWKENGGVLTTEATYTFTAEKDREIFAKFEPKPQANCVISASATPSGAGSVTGGGTYANGATVTLTATANADYVFAAWTENGAEVSSDATYSFTAQTNRTLFAKFEPKPQDNCVITATATPSEAGTVTGGGTYTNGKTVTLTATANEYYEFVAWTENGAEVSTADTYTFTAKTNRSLVARFKAKEQVNCVITATATPSEAGTVNGAGNYNNGAEVQLTATPNTGYKFVAWTENGAVVSNNAAYTFTASTNRSLVAKFEEEAAPTKAKTTTNITASCSKVTRGCAVTFSVTVKDASGKNVTDGYVQLYVNGVAVGSAVKAGKGITWKLTAAEKTKFVLGDNVIKAVYGGTDTLAPSEDAAAVKMVKPSKHYKPCCNIDHHSGKCVNVCPGEDVTFKVNLSCGETCQWYVDKGDGCGYVRIKGAICHSYTVKDVTSRMDGYRYRCVIRNSCGIVETPTFTLNIACGTLATPKTGDMGLLSPAAAMGAAAVCMLKRRRDEE